MFRLIVENEKGQQMELTNNEAYVVYNILGLDPSDAVINTNRNANADGSVFNSAYIDNKTFTITLAINSPAEDNRLELYKYFKNKRYTKIYFESERRNVYLEGYCQRISVNNFEKKVIAQITVFCPDPYFKAVDSVTTQISQNQSLFEFPFSIQNPIPFSEIENTSHAVINDGDIKVGAIFTLTSRGNAVDTPKIINVETNEFIKLNWTIQHGIYVVIDTISKEKSVQAGTPGNMHDWISILSLDSSWLELDVGENHFAVAAEQNISDLEVSVEFRAYYEGV